MGDRTEKYSISMPRAVAAEARARGGTSGLSAYVTAAVTRQIRRDNLGELVAAFEAEHGPITEADIQAKRDALRYAREQQGTAGRDSSGQGAA